MYLKREETILCMNTYSVILYAARMHRSTNEKVPFSKRCEHALGYIISGFERIVCVHSSSPDRILLRIERRYPRRMLLVGRRTPLTSLSMKGSIRTDTLGEGYSGRGRSICRMRAMIPSLIT